MSTASRNSPASIPKPQSISTKKRLRYGEHPEPLDTDCNYYPPSCLSVGDHIFERTVLDERKRFGIKEVKASYRRLIVREIQRDSSGWQWCFHNRLPATEELVQTLLSDSPAIRSYPPPGMPDFPRGPDPPLEPDFEHTRWECPPETPPQLNCSPKSLDAVHLEGEGSLMLVNRLLAGGPDGRFDHKLPGVPGFKHAFLAVHDSFPYSVATLEVPYNSDTGDGNGEVVLYLTRLCNHPHAPKNTSSWFLARIRGWIRHNTDVEKLVALAGIDDNTGTVYDAADFTYEGTETAVHSTFGEWARHRWVTKI